MALRHFAFLLIDRFALMPFSAAVEPLRAANRLSGQTLYEWRFHTPDGGPVSASNGLEVRPHAGLEFTEWPDVVLVCASLGVHEFNDLPTFAWLRRHARRGIPLGAVSCGSQILARAGLLDGYRCTIHWENHPGFQEDFPKVRATDSVFEMDRDRYTAAGGTAALDLVLALVARDQGRDLAVAVSAQFIHDRLRDNHDHQREVSRVRLASCSPKLAAAVAIMERQLESPQPLSEVAERIGTTPRHLERLFRKYLQKSPRNYALELRLRHARELLLRTRLPVIQVAMAAGFVSASHFTKCYRQYFGRTPTRERTEHALPEERAR